MQHLVFTYHLACPDQGRWPAGVTTVPPNRPIIRVALGGKFTVLPAASSRVFPLTSKWRKISTLNLQHLIRHQFDSQKIVWISALDKWENDMACVFRWKMMVSLIKHLIPEQIANEKCANKGNWILYEMAISIFIFKDFPTNDFFLKNCF